MRQLFTLVSIILFLSTTLISQESILKMDSVIVHYYNEIDSDIDTTRYKGVFIYNDTISSDTIKFWDEALDQWLLSGYSEYTSPA